MKTLKISPNSDGSFPVVPHNTLVSLSLGNGSRFDVVCTPSEQGLVLSVLTKGAYAFHFTPSYAYLGGKLGLLDGDAICFVRFLAAQLEATRLPGWTFSEFPGSVTYFAKKEDAEAARERADRGIVYPTVQ